MNKLNLSITFLRNMLKNKLSIYTGEIKLEVSDIAILLCVYNSLQREDSKKEFINKINTNLKVTLNNCYSAVCGGIVLIKT